MTGRAIPVRLTIGERLRYYRRAQGMTQASLAHAIRQDAASVCRMEAGEREPSASQLEALVRALGLTMATFYGETA